MRKIKNNFQKINRIIKRFRQTKINENLIKNWVFAVFWRKCRIKSIKMGVMVEK